MTNNSAARLHLRPDGIPTRADRSLMSSAEMAITEAMAVVEAAGASTALTDAVVLLGRARDRVADHVEGQGSSDSCVDDCEACDGHGLVPSGRNHDGPVPYVACRACDGTGRKAAPHD